MEDEPGLEGLARSTGQLTNGDVAGAGVGPDGGASSVDGSADVMLVQRALHGDGLRDVDGARAGVSDKVELGSVAEIHVDGAGAGGEFPFG